MSVDILALNEAIKQESQFVDRTLKEVAKVVVGQKEMLEAILMGLLTGGHVLLEGVPGLAKTLTISSIAQAINLGFQRVQFTPDLLPTDLIGTMIYDAKNGDFRVKKGAAKSVRMASPMARMRALGTTLPRIFSAAVWALL